MEPALPLTLARKSKLKQLTLFLFSFYFFSSKMPRYLTETTLFDIATLIALLILLGLLLQRLEVLSEFGRVLDAVTG